MQNRLLMSYWGSCWSRICSWLVLQVTLCSTSTIAWRIGWHSLIGMARWWALSTTNEAWNKAESAAEFYKVFGQEQLHAAQQSGLGVRLGPLVVSGIGQADDTALVTNNLHNKTGVWIPYEDVSACHRFGKAKSNSFVLKVWNMKSYSAWDDLSWGMRTGKGFSNKNIFINFMLTARRTELSKQVRQAKKDKLIGKYSIDQNGKIFVKPLGSNTNFKLVSCADDLNKLKKTSWTNSF